MGVGRDNRLLVSVFTDASWNQQTKVGAWGAWAKSERGKVEGGDRLKESQPSSNSAELCAVANGLHIALKAGVVLRTDKVLFQTDNSHAIGVIRGKIKPQGEQETKAYWWLMKMAAEHDLVLITKHVKGHVRNGERRHWVNNLCDRIARSHMP